MIREQAKKLMQETHLLELLSVYGTVSITGSYTMDLMCWNDLDLYIEDNEKLHHNWFQMISDLFLALKPYKFNGFCKSDQFFVGCEMEISGERWNVDIWVRNREHINNAEKYCSDIVQRIEQSPELKADIISLKKQLIQLNMYGLDKQEDHHYHSHDIYKAVLEEGIRTVDELIERHPV